MTKSQRASYLRASSNGHIPPICAAMIERWFHVIAAIALQEIDVAIKYHYRQIRLLEETRMRIQEREKHG